jgi:hypothetical protein
MNFEDEAEAERREQFLRSARHEFGHYIMARIVGFKTGEVSVVFKPLLKTASAGHVDLIFLRPVRSLEDAIKHSRDRIKVAFAGVVAGEMVNGVVDEQEASFELENGGGKDDRTKAIEHLQFLRNALFPDSEEAAADTELKQLFGELWAETINIIQSEREIIEALAEQLWARRPRLGSAVFTAGELDTNPLIVRRFNR